MIAAEGPAKSGLHVGTTLSAVIVLQILSAFGIQWYTVAHLGVGAKPMPSMPEARCHRLRPRSSWSRSDSS
jgi:hypothetical protein